MLLVMLEIVMENETTFSVYQAARELNCSSQWIRVLLAEQRLSGAHKVDGQWRIGEHLNGWGKPCLCTTRRPEKERKQLPNAPPEAPKKLIRFMTWAAAEMLEAEKRGVPVYLQSRDWGKK